MSWTDINGLGSLCKIVPDALSFIPEGYGSDDGASSTKEEAFNDLSEAVDRQTPQGDGEDGAPGRVQSDGLDQLTTAISHLPFFGHPLRNWT